MESKLLQLLKDGVACLETIYSKLVQSPSEPFSQTAAHSLVDLWSALEASKGLLRSISDGNPSDHAVRVSCAALVGLLRTSFEEASRIALKDGLIFKEQVLFSQAINIIDESAKSAESNAIRALISA